MESAVLKKIETGENGESQESREHDACGIGAVVNRMGTANRMVVETVLAGLCDMDLRGAKMDGTGDGAGVMFRTRGMRKFLERFVPQGMHVPNTEQIYAGNFFFSRDELVNLPALLAQVNDILGSEGIHPLSWRTSIHSAPANSLHIDPKVLGHRARETMPVMAQLIFAAGYQNDASLLLALHKAKLAISSQMKSVETVSLEKGTITYKAMSTGAQLRRFYGDFKDPDFVSDAGLFHVRFATNVLSRWILAQLFRVLGHNGEINTIAAVRDEIRDIEKALRLNNVLMKNGSDSADLDRVVELFHAYGVPLGEVFRRFLQPTLDDQAHMPENVRMYHEGVRRALGALSAVEGPAAIVAMDEEEAIGILDGLGLRPLRLILLKDGRAIITSEIGAPDIPIHQIGQVYQLDAGEMVAIKKDGKVLLPSEADKDIVSKTGLNYEELALGSDGGRRRKIILLQTRETEEIIEKEKLIVSWNRFGGSIKLKRLLQNMALDAKEPVIGMGNDMPPAVFSRVHPRLAGYFRQIVAVVTNPPMDPIREGASMNMKTYLGRRPKASEHGHEYKVQPFMELETPFLTEEQFQNLLEIKGEQGLSVYRIETNFHGTTAKEMNAWISDLKKRVIKIARNKKHSVIVLSDRGTRDGELYVPPSLIISALHNELTKLGLRRNVSLVCDTGEAFESHDMALLVAMGADAVNPYLVWQSVDAGIIEDPNKDTSKKKSSEELKKNLMETYVSMLRRIMSKMGITSIDGYRKSKLMHAVGIDPSLLQYYFRCPGSNLGGVTLDNIVQDIIDRSQKKDKILDEADERAYAPDIRKMLEEVGGWKTNTPEKAYELFLALVKEQQAENPVYYRDLLELVFGAQAIQIENVMPKEEIFKNNIICGSGMSVGALQPVAHEAIAAAFNDLGGSANTGEGGFPPERNPGGPRAETNCKIRQRASALFGANAEYFALAEEIEIKIGQGAKPGEGGHLPAVKVNGFIARLRHTQPGIDLISPPPLHDVYSIEDLTRLIQDLRAINPKARIAVKITANTDIGTVAVGVSKAGADIISLSGAEGSTGAAMQSSIEHTGLPLEESLAEVHQALTRNGIRDLVKIRADGGIKTGEDIIKLACLGADQFALGTALIVAGERCIFCHSCSGQAKGKVPGAIDECPTGIMTKSKRGARRLGLGAGSKSLPIIDHDDEKAFHSCRKATKHYLELLAEDVRGILAKLGKRNIEEIVGDTTLLKQEPRTKEANRLDLSRLLRDVREEIVNAKKRAVGNRVNRALKRPAINRANQKLIDNAKSQVAEGRQRIEIHMKLGTDVRSFGATLAGMAARKEITIPERGIHIYTRGFAGQSYAFCNIPGIHFYHEGYVNDFASMAQSGGKTVLSQPKKSYRQKNSLGGNACAYGASDGALYGAGKFGQRFGVRNCGALLVSQGTGKYPYEYMTGGIGVDLDRTGNEGGAGMMGGRLFLRDEDKTLEQRLHSDVIVTSWTKRDKALLLDIVRDFAKETGSPLAESFLMQPDFHDQFKRVVPKDHYVNAIAAVLAYDFYRVDDSVSLDGVIENAAIELTAFLGTDEDDPRLPSFVSKIKDLKRIFFDANDKFQELDEPDLFNEAKRLSHDFIETIKTL